MTNRDKEINLWEKMSTISEKYRAGISISVIGAEIEISDLSSNSDQVFFCFYFF